MQTRNSKIVNLAIALFVMILPWTPPNVLVRADKVIK
jgi:hypothetical protein